MLGVRLTTRVSSRQLSAWPVRRRQQLLFSSSSSSAAVSSDKAAAAAAPLSRHGPGDGVITLNVGGTEFITLRSTVAQNAVLWDHVVRAEANQEFTHSSKTDHAVFIDRHPTHFGLILQHLRNRGDNSLSSSSSSSSLANNNQKGGTTSSSVSAALHVTSYKKMMKKVQIQLPKDSKQLRDLYVEAAFYDIQELQEALCHASWMINLASVFSGGGGNPFDMVARLATQLRTALMATTATTGLGTLVLTLQEDFDYALGLVGLSRASSSSSSSSDKKAKDGDKKKKSDSDPAVAA